MTRRDFDPAALGARLYPLMNSVVVPRPIAWVSTRSPQGVDNLAPHSFFTVASVTPPVLLFTSVGAKDSLRNAAASGEFVVAFCSEALADAVNATATDFPPDVSEFDACGLTREPGARVQVARVAESPVNIECRLIGTQDFGGDSVVVFGEVVWMSIDASVLDGDHPDVRRLAPIARLGRNEWGAVGEVTERRRVPYAELLGQA